MGIRYDKLPGEWYGPTTAACVLRDISELYAARLSPPPRRKSEEPRAPSPPPLPPPSVQKAPSLQHPPVIPTRQLAGVKPESAAGSGDLAARDPLAEGKNGGGPARVDTVKPTAAPSNVEGLGLERDTRRPNSALPPANGEARGGSGVGDCDVGKSGAVFPASRPLRVFVSQGDVVYIDEVEAVAIRGSDAATAENAVAANGNAGGGTRAEVGTSAPSSAIDEGGKTVSELGGGASPLGGKDRSDSPAHLGKGGGVASPAFFDPLLNPGSGEGRHRQEEAWSSAVVLLVPLRLGLDELSAGYIPSELFYDRAGKGWLRFGALVETQIARVSAAC